MKKTPLRIRRAIKRGARKITWRKLRPRTCFVCKIREEKYRDKTFTGGKSLEHHHIIPRSEGGQSNARNCICVCGTCHNLIEGLNWGQIMEIKKEKERERKEKRLADAKKVTFKCPKTGNLCVIGDPTEEQKRMVARGKLTCFDLLK